MISLEAYSHWLNPVLSARWLRRLAHPLVKAFAISVAFHLFVFTTLELGQRVGLWQTSLLARLFNNPARASARLTPTEAEKLKAAREEQTPPMLYVDVLPVQATPDPPPDAKYYSAMNSRAANPDVRIDSPVPKLAGTQTKVPQTVAVPRPGPQPMQPAPPPTPSPAPTPAPAKPIASAPTPPVKPQPQPPQPKQQAKLIPGDLTFSKPADRSAAGQSQTPFVPEKDPAGARQRPRTLAAARQQNPALAGEQMKQDGGVRRLSLVPSLDVKATPFGQYDALFIAAVQKCWYDLIDEHGYGRGPSGKVVLTFHLRFDGKISDMKVVETTVGDLLALVCVRAVEKPSPYAPWPSDLRRMQPGDFRDVQFTFYYN
jgi:hypothetical protein